MNLNKAIIAGRLTRDPELKTLPSGQSVCNFSVATSRFWSDRETNEKKEKTEFHNIVAWGRQAEIVDEYLTKGSLILIEGRIETRSWEDMEGGKRYRTEIIAENIQLGPKRTFSSNQHSADQDKNDLIDEIDLGKKVPIIDKGEEPKLELESDDKQKPNLDEEDEEIDIAKIPF